MNYISYYLCQTYLFHPSTQSIQVEYSNLSMSQQQARTAFLQHLSKLPTYGSVFFEVKVSFTIQDKALIKC